MRAGGVGCVYSAGVASSPGRFSLFGIMGGLMVADHLGDVRDELDHLCDLVGIPRFQGGFGPDEPWTEADWLSIGHDPEVMGSDE